MGLITPTLPTLGQPFASEAADVGNALQAIIAEINGLLDSANIADGSIAGSDLAPDVLAPWQPVFAMGGPAAMNGSLPNTTYLLRPFAVVTHTNDASLVPVWTPDPASVAIAGKTAQVRLVHTLLVNGTAPGVNFSVQLCPVTAVAGGASNLLFTLGSPVLSVAHTAPTAGTRSRVASAPVSLSTLAAVPHCFVVVSAGGGGSTNASSVSSFHPMIELRHS